MPPVPLRIRGILQKKAPRPISPGSTLHRRVREEETKKEKQVEKKKKAKETKEGEEEEIHERIAQSWIIYHLAGALAERNRRHNNWFATQTMRKISLDLHHYVLSACERCSRHHLDYLEKHPVQEALALEGGFEEYVFDLHNNVNERAGKPVLAKGDHLPAVVAHYREALACLGKGASATVLSRALPILTSRFCYGCQ